MTAGAELFPLALLRKTDVVAVDWLIPSWRILDGLRLLRRMSFVVIRRADVSTLRRRFAVAAAQCKFVHFPAPEAVEPSDDGDYVYSAGWAHRDWPTLLAALGHAGVPAVIAGDVSHPAPPNVHLVPPMSPDEGRRYMRGARCVVLAMLDTELPSGPLLLLDAMAHGKPVIATNVGGTRDYVDDENEALLVAPSDSQQLADAIVRVYKDVVLRHRLGVQARDRARTYTAELFWSEVLES